MDRGFLSKFMFVLGAFVLIIPPVVLYIGATMDTSAQEEINPVDYFVVGLLISVIPAIITFLNARKWTSPVKYNKKGEAKTKLHFYTTLLIIYLLALALGLAVMPVGSMLLTGLGMPASGAAVLIALCALVFVLIYTLRKGMREEETIEYMNWQKEKVYRLTRWPLLILVMLLPTLIFIAIVLIFIYIAFSVLTSSNTRKCRICGRDLDASGWCSHCKIWN